MNLILTMAGKYTRFANEGYKIPKYLLPWGDKTILSEILHQFTKDSAFDEIFLVANNADLAFMPHVKRIMKSYEIDTNNLFMVCDTESQAETAFMGLQALLKEGKEPERAVAFHNIDTILYKRDFSSLENLLKNSAGYIDVFKSNNHSYSYVLLNENEKTVREIREKVLISDLATSGFYAFSSPSTFIDYYERDPYISDVYGNMIRAGVKVEVGEKHNEQDTLVLGTPAEYLNLTSFL